MVELDEINLKLEIIRLEKQIPWLDSLLGFVYGLRETGFRVSFPQFIAVQQLLLALAVNGQIDDDFESLKTYLAPIFCHSADDQQRFYHHFNSWLKSQTLPTLQPAGNPEIDNPDIENVPPTPTGKAPEELKSNFAWRRELIVDISLIILLGMTVLMGLFPVSSSEDFSLSGVVREADSPQSISGAEIYLNNQKNGQSDSEGKFAFNYQSEAGQSHGVRVTHAGYETFSTSIQADHNQAPLEVLLKRIPPPPAGDETPSPTGSPVGQLSESEIIYSWLLILAVTIPFLLFGLWVIWRLLWRKYIERWRDRNKPDLRRIKVEKRDSKLYGRPEFLRLARELTKHRRLTSNTLDPLPTIEATLRSGNFFTPVYGIRQLSPEYLVLIDRLSYKDQNAELADEIVSRLKKNGVFVDRFFFEGDPRASWREDKDDKFYDLAELAARFPDHRLLIFSDGEELIDPALHHPQPWLEELSAWDIRLLLTTNAAHDFNKWVLNHFGLPVLPVHGKELKKLVEIIHYGGLPHQKKDSKADIGMTNYPPALRQGGDEWWMNSQDPDREIKKQKRALKRLERRLWWSKLYGWFGSNVSEELKKQIRGKQSTELENAERLRIELRYYLGPTGYELLCACAVYPEMLWDLTYYLAHKLVDASDREAVLEAVVCLPWFRYGRMPDWLRSRLLTSLPAAREGQIRQELERLLISFLQNPKHGFRLEVASSKPSQNIFDQLKKRLKQWFRKRFFYESIKTAPAESPLRDYVFLNFFSGGRLSVALPRRLNLTLLYGKDLVKNWVDKLFNLLKSLTVIFFNFLRAFYRQGNPLLGLSFLKSSLIPLAAAGLGILILLLPASIWLVAGFPRQVATNLPVIDLGIKPPFELPTPTPTVISTVTPTITPTPVSPTPTISPTPDSPTPPANSNSNVNANLLPSRTPPGNSNANVNRTVTPSANNNANANRTVAPSANNNVNTNTNANINLCPAEVTLTVFPKKVGKFGSALLTASVSADVGLFTGTGTFNYNYSVSGGKIIGQGSTVNWDLSVVPPGTYSATVEVSPDFSCIKTSSVTISVTDEPIPQPRLLDQYGKITSEDEMNRFQSEVQVEMANDPTSTVYIIYSGGTPKEKAKRLRDINRAIDFLRLDRSRITIRVDGGNTAEPTTKLWLVPAGAESPIP